MIPRTATPLLTVSRESARAATTTTTTMGHCAGRWDKIEASASMLTAVRNLRESKSSRQAAATMELDETHLICSGSARRAELAGRRRYRLLASKRPRRHPRRRQVAGQFAPGRRYSMQNSLFSAEQAPPARACGAGFGLPENKTETTKLAEGGFAFLSSRRRSSDR